ncbi:MAG: hypothetical protein Q8S84_03295 [bacterium]|nr:hypothetical protein [bacterium]MDP3380550.1 hypothetical protein [bacterium]
MFESNFFPHLKHFSGLHSIILSGLSLCFSQHQSCHFCHQVLLLLSHLRLLFFFTISVEGALELLLLFFSNLSILDIS